MPAGALTASTPSLYSSSSIDSFYNLSSASASHGNVVVLDSVAGSSSAPRGERRGETTSTPTTVLLKADDARPRHHHRHSNDEIASFERSLPVPPGPLDGYLSREGRARHQGTLRSLAGSFAAGQEGVISLAAGFPTPLSFPLQSMTLGLRLAPQDPYGEDSKASREVEEVSIDQKHVRSAQQYNAALRGHPDLVAWIERHVEAVHSPPCTWVEEETWKVVDSESSGREKTEAEQHRHRVLVTNGANHALELITTLFLDRDDVIVMEEYTYPVITESICGPKGICALPIAMDEHGMIPEELENALNRRRRLAGRRGPKLLYTIPTGHNPTGCTTSDDRRKQIYKICRAYDVWILEDDPYYYLQYGGFESSSEVPGLYGIVGSSLHGEFGSPRYPRSYLSMDVDQRVIRVDTFSKFLAPGLRLGWVTARADVIHKLTCAIHAHTVGPCGLSQAVVTSLLHAWGDDGLDAHLRTIQREYARRCRLIAAVAHEHLKGLARWQVPSAGMFLWVKILGIKDADEIWDTLREFKVIVCPGWAMSARNFAEAANIDDGNSGEEVVGNGTATLEKERQTRPGDRRRSPYLRISFSGASDEELEEGIVRLGKVLRWHRTVKDGVTSKRVI